MKSVKKRGLVFTTIISLIVLIGLGLALYYLVQTKELFHGKDFGSRQYQLIQSIKKIELFKDYLSFIVKEEVTDNLFEQAYRGGVNDSCHMYRGLNLWNFKYKNCFNINYLKNETSKKINKMTFSETKRNPYVYVDAAEYKIEFINETMKLISSNNKEIKEYELRSGILITSQYDYEYVDTKLLDGINKCMIKTRLYVGLIEFLKYCEKRGFLLLIYKCNDDCVWIKIKHQSNFTDYEDKEMLKKIDDVIAQYNNDYQSQNAVHLKVEKNNDEVKICLG